MTGERDVVFRYESGAARVTDLPALAAMITRACAAARAPAAARDDVRLAVEEAFTNIVVHGYGAGSPGPVRCEAEAHPDHVVVRIEDDAAPWDPADVPPPPLATDWSEREIGGLGWHLIGQLMDEVRHARRTPRGNTLVLVKRWQV